MARPALLTDDVKQYIAELKLKNPNMQAKDVIREVESYLVENYPQPPNGTITREDIKEIVCADIPRPAIVKYLTEVNRNLEKPSGLDKPWHMGTLKDYSLPPEAIPYVLRVKSKFDKNTKGKFGAFGIRQAIWVSRLFTTIKNIDSLNHASFHYSLHEIICDLSGTTLDTSKFDSVLLGYGKNRHLKLNPSANPRLMNQAFEKITGISMKARLEELKKDGEK